MKAESTKAIGFLKLQRSETVHELLKHPKAFHLLTVIALRARYSSEPSLDGLTFGQAKIGDYLEYGMTRQQYRWACSRLAKWGLATFNPSNDGTIATLTDSRVFSLKDERYIEKHNQRNGHQHSHLVSEENLQNAATSMAITTTEVEPPSSHLVATNKKDKQARMDKQEREMLRSLPLELSEFESIRLSEDLSLTKEDAQRVYQYFRETKVLYPRDWQHLHPSELPVAVRGFAQSDARGVKFIQGLQPAKEAKDYSKI